MGCPSQPRRGERVRERRGQSSQPRLSQSSQWFSPPPPPAAAAAAPSRPPSFSPGVDSFVQASKLTHSQVQSAPGGKPGAGSARAHCPLAPSREGALAPSGKRWFGSPASPLRLPRKNWARGSGKACVGYVALSPRKGLTPVRICGPVRSPHARSQDAREKAICRFESNTRPARRRPQPGHSCSRPGALVYKAAKLQNILRWSENLLP